MAPRSLTVATQPHPRAAPAEVTTTASTSPSARAEHGALQQEYQRDRQDPDCQGLQVEFTGMDESVDGADDTVSPVRFVAGEVGQLSEDDIDPDSADEPHHHGVRHEPQDRTEPQKPGHHHHSAR